jgi:aerobic-type carbon monoxide dehydrogenase small subunit (CoxS/CutS family)
MAKRIDRCLTPLKAIAGAQVMTIEGLAKGEELHPLQQAFIDHGAFQCGYCTAGMLIDAYALLQVDPQPSHEKIVGQMERNLCRCGAHQRIVVAVEQLVDQAGSRK